MVETGIVIATVGMNHNCAAFLLQLNNLRSTPNIEATEATW